MFHASDGLIHLLFANADDKYYTQNLMQLDFLPYLRYRLYQSEPAFRNIYLLFEAPKGSDYDYQFQWVGAQSLSSLEIEQRRSLFGGLFGRRNENNEKKAEVGMQPLGAEETEERLQTVLNVMIQKNGTVLAMPAELLGRFAAQNTDIQKQLDTLRQHNRSNVLILTAAPAASVCDPLLRCPSLEMNGKTVQLPNGALIQRYLLPELQQAFRSESSYRVMHYELMRKTLGNRLHCWNVLSPEDVRLAVRYAYLRHPDWENCGKADVYAAVLWAWQRSILFRDRYDLLGCRDNPLRKLSVLVQNLEDPAFRLRLSEIAEEELLTDPQQILERFDLSPEPLFLQRAETEQDFVSTLTQYRAVLRGRESLLSEQELLSLLEMTVEFNQPGFLHADNSCEPAYCEFRRQECQKSLRALFDYLRKKQEWNNWDSGIMYILFVLFHYCKVDAELTSGTDDYHYSFRKAVQIALISGGSSANPQPALVQYYMQKSENAPYEEQKAAAFTERTIALLRTLESVKTASSSQKTDIYNQIRLYCIES